MKFRRYHKRAHLIALRMLRAELSEAWNILAAVKAGAARSRRSDGAGN